MLRGIYTAASGMLAGQRRSEMLTNNLANVNSPGYKADEAVFRSFPEYLLSAVDQEQGPSMVPPKKIGVLPYGVYMHELIPHFAQGDLQETQNTLDVAIFDEALPPVEVNGKPQQPRLFYTVQKGEETFYTRNGSFTLDTQNQLVTGDGSLVLDSQGQPIELPSDQFRIDERGFIYDEQGDQVTNRLNANEPVYPVQLGLVQVNNPYDLIKTENNAFRWQGQGEPTPSEGPYQLRQGFIERSNVDSQQTMVDLMQNVRSFENNQKVLTAYNDTLSRLFESARLG